MAENNDFAMGYAMGQDNCNNSGGGWGMDGGWGGLIGLLIIASLFGGGWGGGFGGGFGGGRGGGYPCATQEDVRAAVDQQTLISKLDQQTYGLADTFTALNNTLNNNFRGIDNAVCTLGFNNQQGFNNLGHQLSDCCCETRTAILNSTNALQKQISDCCCDLEKMNMQNRFDAANASCNTLQAIDKLGDRILGYLTNKETQDLRDEVQGYRLAASQAKQNQYLIDQLRPCPVPSYNVPAPFYYGHNGNCGGCGYNCC